MIKYCIVFISLLGIAVGNSEASNHEEPVTECGYNATKPAGSLATNGSMALGPNTECMWRIDVENVTEIFIFLRIMDLEEGDNVTLYENENDKEPLFGPFHGQNDQVVILTGVKTLVVRLHTSSEDSHNFRRHFDAGYRAQGPCVITIDEGTTVTAPVSSKNRTSRECTYIYNVQSANMNSFIFETFNLSPGSSVDVSDCENPGAYTQKEKDLIPEFFSSKKATFAIILNNSEDNFRLTKHNVNAECSGYEKIKSDDAPIVLKTPAPLRIDNSSIVVECRKMIESRESTQKLGIDFGNLDFNTVFDILAVNDGPSMLSTPLLQITQTNINETKVKMVRTNGPYIWIAFKPITFASKFAGNVSVHGQGGHYNGSGHIKMISTTGNDTVFLLEVNNNKNVLLNFTSSDFKPPAMLSIYEEFDTTSNPIATLHGSVWYPILSSTSKMMLKATNFQTGQFEADFSGVTPGCMHMSPPTGDNYIVSGNCNSTCVWVIPPTDDKDKNLLLNLQYLSLDKNDEVEILHLDSKKTSLAKITPNISHVPQFFIDSKVGAIVNVIRGACTQEKDDIILVAHTNYLPACSKSFSLDLSEKLQITSPSYPNTYPLLAECEWNIARSNANHKLYLSFDKLQLAPNHCINILEQNTTTNFTFYGNHLPDDFIFHENAIVQFKSVNCNNSVGAQALVSDEGFVLNATAMDCGDVITTKNGQFNTVANKTFCIWKVSVDPKEKNGSLNIITFNVKRTQDNGNYELFIYDGSSVRDIMITNTSSEIWSRTNTVIFMYKLLNTSEPAPVINFSYETKSCSVLCNNGICLHPDWKCNSVNDCGDWSDEKDCQALPPIPVPPEIKKSGVSSVTFGLTVVCFFILGVVLTLVVPRALQYYRNSQYRQFRDLSVGE